MMVDLQTQLKQLCLQGMRDTLTVRNQEATANQLGYLEFLSLLAQDELLLRQQRRYARRYKQSGLKAQKTIEAFDFTFNPKINQTLIRDLATCRFIEEKVPILIVGPCGTGKSHIAQALGHCALMKGCSVIATTQGALSDTLQSARATGTYTKQLKALTKVSLLIIDDFGLKPLRSPQDENLHDLLAARYESGATIVTSNLALQEWQQAFPNQLLGAASIDRLRHNAYSLTLEGKSFRSVNHRSSTGQQPEAEVK